MHAGRLPAGVRHVVAVASGKGGVGKSTIAVNLALALREEGRAVALLDADLFGPSVPRMLNLENMGEPPRLDPERKVIRPLVNYGIKCMSMGLLKRKQEGAVIWRGIMVTKALEQLVHQVDWGPTDVLVIDMPPGTGDAQISICQNVKLAGIVIATTPQQVAVSDADKAIDMFKRMNVPILGIVQNMSKFQCPHCQQRSDIFSPPGSASGAHGLAEKWQAKVLADFAIDAELCAASDTGMPLLLRDPAHAISAEFRRLARALLKEKNLQ